MKTFQQFKEEIKKKTFEPLEKFGRNFAKEGEKFAKSKEANDLKNNVMNFFLDKAQGANNNLGDTIKNIRSKVNK